MQFDARRIKLNMTTIFKPWVFDFPSIHRMPSEFPTFPNHLTAPAHLFPPLLCRCMTFPPASSPASHLLISHADAYPTNSHSFSHSASSHSLSSSYLRCCSLTFCFCFLSFCHLNLRAAYHHLPVRLILSARSSSIVCMTPSGIGQMGQIHIKRRFIW